MLSADSERAKRKNDESVGTSIRNNKASCRLKMMKSDGDTIGAMPKQRHPTPEERDERVSLPLPPEQAIEAILATGPHPDDEDDEAHNKNRTS